MAPYNRVSCITQDMTIKSKSIHVQVSQYEINDKGYLTQMLNLGCVEATVYITYI